MAGEQAIDQADVVADKKPEGQTDQARRGDQPSVEPREFVSREGKRQRDGGGDEHHARNCSYAKNQQIEDRPSRVANRAQHQQCHGGGACQSVDDTDKQRAQGMEYAKSCKRGTKPRRRNHAFPVMLSLSAMRVPMQMEVRIVFVKMGVVARHFGM